MKLSGTIKMICNPVHGTSKAGKEWDKQEFVVCLDGGGNYPDELCVAAFGDEKIAIVQHLAVGEHVDLLVDARAQEYNGRYYNSINLYRIDSNTESQPQAAQTAPTQQAAPAPAPVQSAMDFTDDGLPF